MTGQYDSLEIRDPAVREREQFYLSHGIHSVPAVIINDRHLISGGQPAAVFEQVGAGPDLAALVIPPAGRQLR